MLAILSPGLASLARDPRARQPAHSRPKKERAMRTIAVVNQKGGCGKTIASINLSAFLALAGRRVLLVDLDPQGHSTLGLSGGGVAAMRTMYDVLLGETRRPQI